MYGESSTNESKDELRKEMIKTRAEINTETKEVIQRTNETRSCFFERIKKIDKSLAGITRTKEKYILIKYITSKMKVEKL